MKEMFAEAKPWWITLLSILAISCLLPLTCSLTAPNAEKALARVPIGSKLVDIDQLIIAGYDSSEVYEWIPTSKLPDSWKEPINTEFGTFFEVHIGSHDRWQASQEERNSFTGEITLFYHSMVIPDDLNPSFYITYVYVDGILKKKELGYLPG